MRRILIVVFGVGLVLAPSRGAAGTAGELTDLQQQLQTLRELVARQQTQLDAQARELERLKAGVGTNGLADAVQRPAQVDVTDRETFKAHVQDVLQELRITGAEQTPEERRLTTIYDDGFYLKGHDDTLRIGGWYQGDVQLFPGGQPGNTRVRNRRARLDLRGVLETDFGYRLYGEFAGSGAKLQEAWLSYDHWPFARLKLGQVKEPFSLEASYSARWIDFVERSIGVTNLQPAEDLGVMLFGKGWGDRIEYGVGFFNGRGKNVEDNNDDEDLAARVVLAPFHAVADSLVRDLYVGASVTHGKQDDTIGGSSFTTAAGTPFLTFVSGAAQDGFRTRYGTDVQWIYGPGDVKVEWIGSRFDNLNIGTAAESLTVSGWYASVSHVLTGERKRRNRPIKPARDFVPGAGGWGAWEVMGRLEQFFVNHEPIRARLVSGTNRVDAATVGLTWWPNVHTKIMGNYVWSMFDDPVASGGALVDDEHVMLVRVQYNL